MIARGVQSYLSGYMKINVEGYFIERFINICTQKNIKLWNMKRKGETVLISNISIQDFKRLKIIARKTKCKIRIKKKKGLPFFFERYKKRKLLGILIILILIAIMVVSNFIWNIQIECDGQIEEEEIKTILTDNGLKIGTNKKDIDLNKIIQSIRHIRADVAWAGIQLEGTNAIVKLVKAEEKPLIIQEDEYCSIISNKEGIITKVNVQNGTAAVKVRRYSKKRNDTCKWMA